ncbi:MAG: hypothetical protein K6F56_04230 [Oscillospiraceae bacterium]|nr:hypothetical protein [Oscillospiraceae bacterium]
MSEANSTPVQEKPKKKKRHLWWLNLLLAVAVFAGGVVLGLKLPGMPLPYELVERYFPQLTAQSGAVATAAVEPVKANAEELPVAAQPVATPAPTQAPKPVETPAPVETVKPEEPAEEKTEAEPAESVEEAEPAEEAEPTESVEEAEPAEPAEETEPESVATVGGFDAPTDITEEQAASAQDEPAEDEAKPAFIGLDAALNAALEHAKLRENEAEVYGVYKSTNVDTIVYVVEFSAKDMDYVYMINAESGEVEGWQKSRSFWDMEGYDSIFPETYGFTFKTEDGGNDNQAI